MKKLLKNQLLIGGIILFVVSMGANVINYLFHLIIGRLLGPIDYGILASLFSLLYILSIVPSSSSFAIVKYIASAKDEEEISYVFYSIKKYVQFISYFLVILFILISPLVAAFLHVDQIVNVILLAPILYFVVNTITYQATLQGLLLFWAQSLPIVISSFGKFVFSIVLVLFGLKVFGAMFGILFSSIVAYYVAKYIADVKVKKIYLVNKKYNYNIRELNKYGFSIFINALAFTSIFTTDVILAKHFLPEFDAGLYASLSTLGKIIFFAAQPITSVMFPMVSKKRSNGEKYRSVFLLALITTIFVSFSVLTIYWFFPKITIRILFGKEYIMAAGALVYMGVFDALYSISYFISNYLLSIGKTKIVLVPVIVSIMQVLFIFKYHSSIIQIINVSIYITLLMLIVISVYLFIIESKYKAKI